MEYTDYFKHHPDAYDKIEGPMDRVHTLYDALVRLKVFEEAQSILSVGCGSGLVELRAVKELAKQLGVLEPTPHYFQQFQKHAEEGGVWNQLLEAKQERFEAYTPTRHYDVVLFIQSWFPFGLDLDILKKALSCRAPGGKLVIVLPAKSCFAPLIAKAYSKAKGISLTSDDLSTWALEEGYPHRYGFHDGKVPEATYFEGEELNATGRDMVAFLTASDWEEIPPKFQHMAGLIMRSTVIDGQSYMVSGVLIFQD